MDVLPQGSCRATLAALPRGIDVELHFSQNEKKTLLLSHSDLATRVHVCLYMLEWRELLSS